MFRLRVVALVALAWATVPASAAADEWEGDRSASVPLGGPANGGGEVSVDIEGATPGLTPELFRSTLGAYGDWYVSARYGDVWRPRVAIGWRPYYYGSWQWTNEGWYWDSSEPFAWAVYHYGRWVYDPAWGWVWVPGYQWAPAWVTWRYGPDAVGWAPLAPGVSVFVTTYPFIDFWWTFVPTVRFVGVPVYTVACRPREIPHWFRTTSPAPPRTGAAPPRSGALAPAPAWGGPARSVIEARIGRPLTAVRREPAWRGGPEAAGRDRAPGLREPAGAVGGERTPGLREPPAGERGRGPAFRPAPGAGTERERSPSRGPAAAPRTERERAPGPAWLPPSGRPERPELRPTPRNEQPRQQGGGRGEDRSPPNRSRNGRER